MPGHTTPHSVTPAPKPSPWSLRHTHRSMPAIAAMLRWSAHSRTEFTLSRFSASWTLIWVSDICVSAFPISCAGWYFNSALLKHCRWSYVQSAAIGVRCVFPAPKALVYRLSRCRVCLTACSLVVSSRMTAATSCVARSISCRWILFLRLPI